MVTFTVKVLICIDMFLKCCAKLKLNTWVKPSGFKDPAKGQRDEDQPGDRSLTLLFYATWLMQKWDLLANSFHMRPTPSAEDFIYLCIWENQQKNGGKHIYWLMLTDEKPFIYTCTFANIFSCLVNLGPVGAGRIFPFMAEVKIWWAMKIKKRWVRELKRHNGILKLHRKDLLPTSLENNWKHFPNFSFKGRSLRSSLSLKTV